VSNEFVRMVGRNAESRLGSVDDVLCSGSGRASVDGVRCNSGSGRASADGVRRSGDSERASADGVRLKPAKGEGDGGS